MNAWLKLDQQELEKVRSLKDPVCDLILINGWRRNELAQVIMNYSSDDLFVFFKAKKQKHIKKYLITEKEQELIRVLQNTIFDKTKKTLSAINKKINNHLSALNIAIHPHRLRATFATSLNRMGVPVATIKEAMNHSKLHTTEGYIQPDQEEILEAKQLHGELMTIDGMTIQEWRRFALDKIKQINRLEERLKLYEK